MVSKTSRKRMYVGQHGYETSAPCHEKMVGFEADDGETRDDPRILRKSRRGERAMAAN